jgi:hypothetical protein
VSLSLLLTALNEFVGDILVNDCGRPAPTRQLSYHGRLPHDCCTDDGFLVTSWESGRSEGGGEPCAGLPAYTVNVRYVVCWDLPEVGTSGVEITDAQDTKWNNDALMLADVADCVARSLIGLTCDDDPLASVLVALSRKQGLRYTGVSPIVPLGGCAGVQWQLNAPVRSGPVIS